MTNSVIKSRIQRILPEMQDLKSSIVVLKGVPLEIVDAESEKIIDLESIIDNKLKYFWGIYGKRQFLTYEEYLLLSSFVIDQYKNIYILVNNIYMNQYPLDIPAKSGIRKGLLTHFMETDGDENDDEELGDIDEYISLYNGVREYNGYLLGAYCDEKVLDNSKIQIINLFDAKKENIEQVTDAESPVDLIEEADYIDFVRKVFEEPDEIYVRISNYTGDINRLKTRLQVLASNWSDWTDFYIVQAPKVDNIFNHREEYTDILKKYWGYSSFRYLSVYDMAKLEDGEKEVIQVSQENIISNLVEQAEKCEEDDSDYRDIFVTAPK